MENLRLEQFAAMNMVYNRHSFSYFLESLERLGIGNFELWTGAPHLNHFIFSQSDAKAVRKELERRKKKIVCVTPEQVMYPHNIAAADKELREFSVQYFLRYIDMTEELGADKMLCCAGWGNYDEPADLAWRRSVASLERLVRRAEQVGITLAFEILCPFESNLVYNLETTKRMMDEIDSPVFRLCVDTVPVRLGGNTLGQFFEQFKERICHVHLTDGTPAGHVPLGMGTHPKEEHLAALDANGYDGYVTLEIGDTSWAADPEKATAMGFAALKTYF